MDVTVSETQGAVVASVTCRASDVETAAGYQGAGPSIPYRKPPKGELTDVRKACNYSHNRLRAAVERAITHLKNWKILKTGYHRIMTDFPDVLRTVTGLEIFRVWYQGSE